MDDEVPPPPVPGERKPPATKTTKATKPAVTSKVSTPRTRPRRGQTFSVSLGYGTLNPFCKLCPRFHGLAYSVSIGGFVAPELAIVGVVSGVSGMSGDPYESAPFFTQRLLALGARYRPVPILALSAAFGAGKRSFIDDDLPPGHPLLDQPLWGPAGILELALTFGRRGAAHFALFARMEHGRYERLSATSIATGFELALW